MVAVVVVFSGALGKGLKGGLVGYRGTGGVFFSFSFSSFFSKKKDAATTVIPTMYMCHEI